MRIEVLLERISDVVFHATTINNAISILDSDTFTLSPAFTGDARDPRIGAKSDSELDTKGRSYFLSTARTRTSVQFAGESSVALIVLDGRKLSHNHSGKAVDYWDADIKKQIGGAYEEEDRIFSDNPTIDNVLQYIISIDVLETRWQGGNVDGIIHLYKLATSKGVPVRVYNSRQDWYRGSDRHIPHEELVSLESSYSVNSGDHRWSKGLHSDMSILLELLNSVNRDDGFKLLYKEKSHRNSTLADALIDGDVDKVYDHIGKLLSLAGSSRDSELRKSVEELGQVMKNKGLKNSKELAKYIVDEWIRPHEN